MQRRRIDAGVGEVAGVGRVAARRWCDTTRRRSCSRRSATGVPKFTCCQPEAVSLVNVAVASSVPLIVHRLPMCVPMLAGALVEAHAGDEAVDVALNFTPSSTAVAVGHTQVGGNRRRLPQARARAAAGDDRHGDAGAGALPGCRCRRPRGCESSPAPSAPGDQSKLQAVVPCATCHVAPPSTDTSTPATTPPRVGRRAGDRRRAIAALRPCHRPPAT